MWWNGHDISFQYQEIWNFRKSRIVSETKTSTLLLFKVHISKIRLLKKMCFFLSRILRISCLTFLSTKYLFSSSPVTYWCPLGDNCVFESWPILNKQSDSLNDKDDKCSRRITNCLVCLREWPLIFQRNSYRTHRKAKLAVFTSKWRFCDWMINENCLSCRPHCL